MTDPVVSILTPTYNHELYIGPCIQSVLTQTFSSWEMIILDDGSTDRTAETAREMAGMDSRIRVMSQENVGLLKLGETYNKGLHASRGKYIAILEGDDVWEANKLERQITALEHDPQAVMSWAKAELVSSDLSVTYDTRPAIFPQHEALYRNDPPGTILELLTMGVIIPALTIVIRKDRLLSIGGFIQSHGMPLVDFPTVLKLSLLGTFHFEPQILGKWRIYPGQTTKKYTIEIHNGFTAFLKDHLPEVNSLDAAKKDHIMRFYEAMCLIAYARSGRYRLIRKEFKNARRDYKQALTYPVSGQWTWRLRALVGYTLSLFRMDVEGLAKLLGKKTYTK